MKKLVSLFLCLMLFLSMSVIPTMAAAPAAANSRTEITYFEDGSYCITVLTEEVPYVSTLATNQTKTGTRTTYMYSASNEQLFSLTVRGTFTYNGTSARATNATYSYTVDHGAWGFDNGSANWSGTTATATAKFNYLLFIQSKTVSVSISCSPTGVLS